MLRWVVMFLASLSAVQCVSHAVQQQPRATSMGTQTEPLTAGKVSVELYMESLCPYCARFVKHTLADLFSSGFEGAIELKFIPWGNAHLQDDGSVECQHGPVECAVNKILACASHINNGKQRAMFEFADCLEGRSEDEIEGAAEGCAKDAGLSWRNIDHCVKGPMGKQVVKEARQKTDDLHPAHKWVPWVVVAGVPIFDDVANLKQYVCVAYTGTKPDACFDMPDRLESAQLNVTWRSPEEQIAD